MSNPTQTAGTTAVSQPWHDDTTPLASTSLGARSLALMLILAILTYPLALASFFAFAGPDAANTALNRIGSWITMIIAFATPAIGLSVIIGLGARGETSRELLRVRRLAHFCVAAPPLFTATGVVLFVAGINGADIIVWSAFWLTVFVVLVALRPDANTPVDAEIGTPPSWLRWSHGIAAAAVLFGYVGLHLGNHLFAAFGTEAHAEVQQMLRGWYRSPVVEPLLIALVAWLVGSGIALARHRTYSFRDGWGSMQTASGSYLGGFLISHVTAALLLARVTLEVDPTWAWAAAEPSGLTGDPWSVRLIPHYFLAVAAVTIHAGCGLRAVLLNHAVRRTTANTVGATVVVAGISLATILTALLLGFRI